MKFTGINLQILDKIGMQKLSFQETPAALFSSSNLQIEMGFLRTKNVVLSGDFFLMNKNSFRENLQEGEVNVQSEITPDTEFLICGQYPDWMLVEDARLYGIKILFVDRAGELFSRIAAKLNRNKTGISNEELLEV